MHYERKQIRLLLAFNTEQLFSKHAHKLTRIGHTEQSWFTSRNFTNRTLRETIKIRDHVRLIYHVVYFEFAEKHVMVMSNMLAFFVLGMVGKGIPSSLGIILENWLPF